MVVPEHAPVRYDFPAAQAALAHVVHLPGLEPARYSPRPQTTLVSCTAHGQKRWPSVLCGREEHWLFVP